ncbi:MAG: DUF4358 domain-containing protein [Oscillospiraceae bacterium]|jgi:hypothetical protein|nr:DUF4358 domain-containing protein [Oscillospiraceae bacterium]
MKKIAAILLLLAIAAGFASCGNTPDSPASPAKEPTIEELTTELDKVFDADAMHELDAERVERELGLSADAFTAYAMKVPTGTNMDEYGVFIAASGREQEVMNAVNAYIGSRQERWMDEYLPDERPKIFDAQAKSQGKYVIYVMAFEDNRSKAINAFDKLTK